jgi:citrate lyase subunit beta / citryl-CoA lyase
MTVMRSVFYIPGNNEKMISKAPETPADIITLDLEDSVPPAEKPKAREMVKENLKFAGKGGSTVRIRRTFWRLFG